MRKNHGFSIVEVVIALAVIMIVTVTAISIVLSSISTKVNAIQKTQAQSFAENVWESFCAAESEEEFLSLVSFAEGITLTDGTIDGDGNTVYIYHSEAQAFVAQISVCFPEQARSEFMIDVKDEDGRSIISFSYQKGDKG